MFGYLPKSIKGNVPNSLMGKLKVAHQELSDAQMAYGKCKSSIEFDAVDDWCKTAKNKWIKANKDVAEYLGEKWPLGEI